MKKIVITLLCLSLASCGGSKTTDADPIDRLVKDLNANIGRCSSWYTSSLPPDASPDEIVAEKVKHYGRNDRKVTSYQIQEIRQVQLNTGSIEHFSAAWVETDIGLTIIVLFALTKDNQWYVRSYD